MRSSTRRNCPSCHTPIAFERYERACGGARSYLVCPECDYTFLLTEAQSIAVSGWIGRAEAGAEESAMAKGAGGSMSGVRATIDDSGSSIGSSEGAPFSASVEGLHLQTEVG